MSTIAANVKVFISPRTSRIVCLYIIAVILVGMGDALTSSTVKSHFKAMGLYNFIRGFGWACKRGGGEGLISGWAYKRHKKNVLERRDKTCLRNQLKLTYHYVLSYIYNTFIVRYNKRRIYFKKSIKPTYATV